MWPFRTIKAEQNASDLAVEKLLDRARLPAPVDLSALAIVEAAIALVSRCMAAAEATGPAGALLTRPLLSIVARRLLERGEAVLVADGAALVAASDWAVTGSTPSPAAWRYRVDLPGPDGVQSRSLAAGDVVHVRWCSDSTEPWKACSSAERAAATAAVATASEAAMDRELRNSPRWFGRMRERLTPDQTRQLRTLLSDNDRTHRNRLDIMGSDAGHWQRVGPDAPPAMTALRRSVQEEICAALGVPPELILPGSEGSARREAWRVFGHSLLTPMAQVIADEVSAKVGGVGLSIAGLAYADLQGKARAFSQLTRGGMDADRAARIVGL